MRHYGELPYRLCKLEGEDQSSLYCQIMMIMIEKKRFYNIDLTDLQRFDLQPIGRGLAGVNVIKKSLSH